MSTGVDNDFLGTTMMATHLDELKTKIAKISLVSKLMSTVINDNDALSMQHWQQCLTTTTMMMTWQWRDYNTMVCKFKGIEDSTLAYMCSTGIGIAALCLSLFSTGMNKAALACFSSCLYDKSCILFFLGRTTFSFNIHQNHKNFFNKLFFSFLRNISHICTLIFD